MGFGMASKMDQTGCTELGLGFGVVQMGLVVVPHWVQPWRYGITLGLVVVLIGFVVASLMVVCLVVPQMIQL